jgi:hypothetical protein
MINIKIAEKIAKFRLRYSRGYAFVADAIRLVQFGTLMTLLASEIEKRTGFKIDLWFIWIGCIILPIILYFIGYFDEKHLGFWKFENQYSSKELNPFLEEIDKKIDSLKGR